MKKNLLPFVILLLFLMLLVSCTRTIHLTPEQIRQKLTEAELAMREGDEVKAEAAFTEILQSDPNNGEGNLGMGLIILLKAHRSMLDMVADFWTIAEPGPEFRLHTSFARSLLKSRSMAETILNFDFSELQSNIATIVSQLEEAKTDLKKATVNMSPEASMTLYPNAFDWNEDGYTDSASPLNLKFEIAGESRVWWILFQGAIYSTERGFFDDETRGDAWFDIESIDYLLDGESIPATYTPVFDDEDHYTMDATAAKVLLTVVNLELSFLEPILIWDLDPKPELTDYITEASNTMDQYASAFDFATQTLDTDKNGTITNAEFRRVLPESFMAFYDDENGGADAINDWGSAIVDFCTLTLELEEAGLFKEILLMNTERLEMIRDLVTDETTGIPISASSTLVPYHFFNSPENFSDLEDFLPDVGYTDGISISLPDPTFGGLLEETE